MVSKARLERQVRRSVEPVRQQLAQRRQGARESLQQIQDFREELKGNLPSVRGLDIGGLASRQQALRNIDILRSEEARVRAFQQSLNTFESQQLPQIESKARSEIRSLIETREFAEGPQERVTIRTLEAQRLAPVRIIDTSIGPIRITGEGAFDLPIAEVLRRTEQVFPDAPLPSVQPAVGLRERLARREGDIFGQAGELVQTGTQRIRRELVGRGIIAPGSLGEQAFVQRNLGITPREIFQSAFFIPAFGVGAVRQVAARKSFVEIATEQLSGLDSQFSRIRLGGQSGSLAKTGFKNEIKRLLGLAENEAQRNAVRELVSRRYGSQGLRLLDEAIGEATFVVRQPREIIRPGQPSQLPPAVAIDPTRPRIVSPEGTLTSEFAGRGVQFERTTEQFNPLTSSQFNSPFFRQQPRQAQLPSLSLLQQQQVGQAQPQAQALSQSLAQQTGQTTPQRSGGLQGLALSLGLRSKQQERQALLLRLRQRFGDDFGRPRQPRVAPRIPVPLLPLPQRDITVLKSALAKIKKGKFIPEFRRNQVWFKLGSGGKTLKAQVKKVSDFVDRDLSASFRIKKGGKIIDLKAIPTGFRRSKTQKNIFVEKRNLRLSTGSEVKEIQMFRKAKGRKSK